MPDPPFVELVKDNMELFRMAERFSDPLFEKVGELSMMGWVAWMEYFGMESAPETENETHADKLVEYFTSKGGHML